MNYCGGFVIALLGAESTGKTTLARALADALAAESAGESTAESRRVAVVDEVLREFCDARGRTPQRHEQQHIAAEQTRRIEAAARSHDIVVADTSALMIAVYSDQVFGDTSLYADAQAAHRRCDLTLLTALDLPWRADGLQRDGAHVREPVDAKLRAALERAQLPYAVVFGTGAARLQAALASVRRARAAPGPIGAALDAGTPRWHWHCERCGDAAGERCSRLPKP